MRVIYIVHSCVPYGANVALINLLDNICLEGVKPLVIYAIDGTFREWLDKRKIESRRVNFYFHAYPRISSRKSVIAFIPRLIKMIYINYKAKRELLKIIDEFVPDLIHTNIGPVKIGFSAAKKRNLPHVWHIREYQKMDFDIRFFPSLKHFRRIIRQSYLISITGSLFKYFEMGSNARVIYDGVMDESESQFITPKEKYFLFVGRLEEAKGTLMLVKTFCEFAKSDKNYKLLLAGTGAKEYVLEIEQEIKTASLEDRIKLLGFRSDRFDLMAKATALIVPSRNEGFGFITAEAMFNGCLVIGKNTAGTKEIISNSKGSAISFNDEDELLNAMTALVSTGVDSCLHQLKKAQEVAVALYSKNKHSEKVYMFYKEILNENNFEEYI